MKTIATSDLFVSRIGRGTLDSPDLLDRLTHSARVLARDDRSGRRWAREHSYPGYTSYASLNDLPQRDPAFADLVRILNRRVAAYLPSLGFADGLKLRLDSLWVNVLRAGGGHSGHIHPHSVVSGTLYLVCPPGCAGLRFEDPRLGLMMVAPPRHPKAERGLLPFVTEVPEPGTILLWESWLRHEVPASPVKEERISVSFNYA